MHFFVTEEDALKYAEFQCKAGRLSSVKSIKAITTFDSVTSYVLEYEDGWEIISADKRGPIILAQGEGNYVEPDNKKSPTSWINSLNRDIFYRWQQKPQNEAKNPQEELSLNFWTYITNPKEIIGGELQTKSNPGDLLGDYELFSLETELVRYDSIPHLTTTKWDQEYAYNYACPPRNDAVNSEGRAYAGCTPVAGAQMLFYLHNSWGVPTLAPSYASCSGTASNPVFDIPNPNSSTIWSQMYNDNNSSSNKAYILIADAGRRGGANYNHPDGTSMSLSGLQPFFGAYGLTCSYSDYQADTIVNSLLRGCPIPVSTTDISGGDPHAFLVDGYIRFQYKYTATYRWVYYNLPPGPVPMVPDAIRVWYSSPEIQLVLMNWGWGGWYNSNRCALSGVWEVNDTISYSPNKMLHNFKITENE